MKKIYLSCLALFCSAWAWAVNGFSIDDITIKAGEEKEIEVKMFNDVTITAFQLNVALPEGVSIKYNEDEEAYCVNRTSRLLNSHVLSCELQQSGDYKIMVYHNSNKNIKGNSGDAVVTITLVASDQVSTGAFTPAITQQEMTATDGTTTTKYKIDNASYNCTVALETTVTTLGYASFSWPKPLDFTNSGLTAYIATSTTNNSLRLESVTKVPANTGLILKGTAGSDITYPLETVAEDDLDKLDNVSENMLTSNCTGDYTIPTDNVYVLSNLDDGKPGFYLAQSGVVVGQYKSYLVLSPNAARLSLGFEEVSTGIQQIESIEQQSNLWYDLQGRRVQNPRNGVYMVNGKLRIIK